MSVVCPVGLMRVLVCFWLMWLIHRRERERQSERDRIFEKNQNNLQATSKNKFYRVFPTCSICFDSGCLSGIKNCLGYGFAVLCLHNIFTHLLFAQPKSGTLDISVKSNEEMYRKRILSQNVFELQKSLTGKDLLVSVSNETESLPAYHTTKGSAYQRKAELFFSSKFVKTLNKFYKFWSL